jgi:hypothetical protein
VQAVDRGLDMCELRRHALKLQVQVSLKSRPATPLG